MKNRLFHLVVLLFALNLFQSENANAQPGQWVWVNGSNQPNDTGHYGVQGVPSPLNSPRALYEACEWTDKNGNFWLYGGNSNSGPIEYSDLWKYDSDSNMWTLIKGSVIPWDTIIYGTQGISSPSNHPGYRRFASATWVDTSGHLWLFGGETAQGTGSDLWKYDINSNEWTWIKGPSTGFDPGTYGIQGIPSLLNNPPSRSETAAAWTDENGDLWMFGGSRWASTFLRFDDLWRFNIATNTWTWMKGSSIANSPGNYGAMGLEASTNKPGSRLVHARWKDSEGNLWMFGGGDLFSTNYFNDIWRFNISTNNWTWMNGQSSPNHVGNYGIKCNTAQFTMPPARTETRSVWVDLKGNFIFFGGLNVNTLSFNWNDLWVYCVANNKWIWIDNSSQVNPPGNWGVKGVSSPTNVPNGRCGSIGWTKNKSDLFLFGGLGNYNDLWKYTLDYNCIKCPSALHVKLFNTCFGDSTVFQNPSTSNLLQNAYWNFGDTLSGILNTSSSINASHIFTAPGSYTVTTINYFANFLTDTITTIVNIGTLPVFSLGNDTTICQGDTVMLSVQSGFTSYQWSTGATTEFISAESGLYFVTVSNYGCAATDSVFISNITCIPNVAFASSDTLFCEKQCIDFFDLSNNNPTSWQWFFNGAVPDTSTLQNPTNICYNNYGTFDVQFIACNALGCDTILYTNFITELQNPTDSIWQSNDTLYSLPAYSYQWYEITSGLIAGATDSFYVYSQPGSYYCVVSDTVGCVATSNNVVITGLTDPPAPQWGVLAVVPNPNDGMFEISFDDFIFYKNCSIEINDVTGRKVFEQKMESKAQEIIFDATDGLYFIIIRADNFKFLTRFVVSNNH